MFTVEDVLFYECGPEIPLKSINNSPLIVFISGLDLANTESASLSWEIFQQWIQGNLETPSVEGIDPSRVVRVVIAGNSITASPAKQEKNMSSLILRTFDTKEMLKSLKHFDE